MDGYKVLNPLWAQTGNTCALTIIKRFRERKHIMNWQLWGNRAGRFAAAAQTAGGQFAVKAKTAIADKEEGSRGFVLAGIVNLAAAIIFPLLTKGLFGWIFFSLTGTILAVLVLFASPIYFGWLGFRSIPVGYQGIQLMWGKRTGKTYKEGWNWNWPQPIGDIMSVDVRTRLIPLPMTEVLTADNVATSLAVALQCHISDIGIYLSAERPEESLKSAAESDFRTIVLKLQSEGVAQEKEVIAYTVSTGSGPAEKGLEGLALQALVHAPQKWGITVSEVQIKSIRLPKEIEDARANVQVEEAQRKAETVEAKHVADMIDILMKGDKGLSRKDALAAVQAERGKRTIIDVGGNASDDVKGGMMIGAGGDLLKGDQTGASSDQATGAKAPRRRGNKQ